MNWKLAFSMLALGLPGSFAITYLALPHMLDTGPVPLQTIQLAALIQNILLVCLASFAGAHFAKKVGLHAPFVSAILVLLSAPRSSGFCIFPQPRPWPVHSLCF